MEKQRIILNVKSNEQVCMYGGLNGYQQLRSLRQNLYHASNVEYKKRIRNNLQLKKRLLRRKDLKGMVVEREKGLVRYRVQSVFIDSNPKTGRERHHYIHCDHHVRYKYAHEGCRSSWP